MTDTVTASFFCPTCNEPITWPADASDETPITCRTCSVTYGTYSELTARALEETKAEVLKRLKRGLGPGWKFS